MDWIKSIIVGGVKIKNVKYKSDDSEIDLFSMSRTQAISIKEATYSEMLKCYRDEMRKEARQLRDEYHNLSRYIQYQVVISKQINKL